MSAKDPSLTTKTLQGFKWTYASLIIQGISQLIVLSILARILTPRDFGLVGIATLFTNFAERVGFLGVGPALVQRKVVTDTHIRVGTSLSIALGVLLFALLFFLAPAVATFFSEPELLTIFRVLSITFLIESFGATAENLLQRELRFDKLLLVQNISYLIGSAAVGITLAMMGFGPWSLVYSAIAFRLCKVGMLLRLYPLRLTRRFPRTETGELLRVGFGFSLGRLLTFAALNGDNFIVGRLLGTSALGMYGRAYQLMTLPATYIGQVLEKVLFPALSRKQDDHVQLRKIFLSGVEIAALVGLPTSIGMYFCAEEIILVLFGRHWIEVIPCLRILAFGVFFRLCYKNSDTLLRALGVVYHHAARQAIYTLVVVVGVSIGCSYGLTGVAFAVTGAVAVNYLVMAHLTLKLINIPWSRFAVAHAAGVWVSTWVVLGLAPLSIALRTTGLHPLGNLILDVAAAAVCFAIGIITLPPVARPEVFKWIWTLSERALGRFPSASYLVRRFLHVS